MDPLLDDSLLWIAEMALTAPLPAGSVPILFVY